MEQLQQLYTSTLGPNCTAEPRVSVVSHQKNSEPHTKYALTDSSIPRRQHDYCECHNLEGSPTRLLARVPFQASTVDNGAVFVIPREFDDWYQESDAWEHSHSCQVRADGVLETVFGIQSVRPLEVSLGEYLLPR